MSDLISVGARLHTVLNTSLGVQRNSRPASSDDFMPHRVKLEQPSMSSLKGIVRVPDCSRQTKHFVNRIAVND